MRVLAAVDTVHTAAGLCDYLDDRLGIDDEVLAVTVLPPHDAGDASDVERDRREALNVADVRLVLPDVEQIERRGDPATDLRTVADDRDVAEIVLAAGAGTPDATETTGSTVQAVLADATRPVVVVPRAAVPDAAA